MQGRKAVRQLLKLFSKISYSNHYSFKF